MRKTILFTLALFTAPVLAEPLNYNVVSFSESARTTIENDVMNVTFAIEEEGRDRQQVSNQTTTRLNALTARIAANREFKSSSTNRNTRPHYNEKGKIIGWHDSAYVNVQSKNFQALNKLIAASQNEASVQNMGFSVSPEKRSKTINELSREALKNFQARAKFISETMGFKGYKIVNIKIDSQFDTFHTPNLNLKARALNASVSEAAPQMSGDNSGTEEVVQTVSGSIQM